MTEADVDAVMRGDEKISPESGGIPPTSERLLIAKALVHFTAASMFHSHGFAPSSLAAEPWTDGKQGVWCAAANALTEEQADAMNGDEAVKAYVRHFYEPGASS